MNYITRKMLGSDDNIAYRGIVWNMLGSAIYAITSMLLGSAVTRIIGADLGGIFYFAFSTFGQQMYIIAYFGMRPIQSTDTAYSYSFGDYIQFRLVTAAAAVFGGILYIFAVRASLVKSAVIILMVCYKIIDAIADCYESEYQRDGRLYMTGKSMAFRTLLSVLGFLIALLVSKDIIIASIAAVAMQAAGLYIFCMIPIRSVEGADTFKHIGSIKKLFNESKWLCLSSFLDLYIFAAAKYAVDAYMEPSASSYFSTIFIPTSVINLMAGFVIRPVLTTLSKLYDDKDIKAFKGIVIKIALLIAVMTVAGMLAAAAIGIPVLSWLLGSSAGAMLSPYRGALVIVILGGGFYAILNLLYYVLTIIKKQLSIFIIYAIGCVAAFILSRYMVLKAGIDGAAISYAMLMIFVAAMFAGVCIKGLAKRG